MTERAIIQRVLAGDTEAFGLLVDRHYDRCARIAYRILGNREDAEEAVQDAFLRAYRALSSYEDRERFVAWVTRILVNQCRTVRAKANRREAVFNDDVDLEYASRRAGTDNEDPGWPDLDGALAMLPPEQREAIVLRYTDDLTYEEMARVTGAGESALKMRVQRAFVRLRMILQEVTSV
ncbi:MAG: RNA polymerase sigma factor [Gemmatimonadota bacterium]|nr:RNA polymerase sigma factor [Gemmatimonadota bacterium]